jgi:hypothetical protein
MEVDTRLTQFPSPTSSNSSMSSSNNTTLFTPENHSRALPSHDLKREADVKAANARFMSATKTDGQDGTYEGTLNLAAALEFSDVDPATHTPATKTLGKRLGHTRNTSSISRRHSIPSMIPTAEAEHEETQRRLLQQSFIASSPFNIKEEINFDDDLRLWQNETEHLNFDLAMSTMQSGDFLLSPPRMVSSVAPSSEPVKSGGVTPSKAKEESKRRRPNALSAVNETPERPMSAQTIMQHTPPNNWTHMQAHASSIQSSAASSQISRTPLSMTTSTTSSSIYESGGSSFGASSIRRRSSISGDRIREIANLTAGLNIPSAFQSPEKSTTPQPRAAMMEYSQSQPAKMSNSLERSDSKAEKSKGPDVWPDDVEVAFWEGEWAFSGSFFLRLQGNLTQTQTLSRSLFCSPATDS